MRVSVDGAKEILATLDDLTKQARRAVTKVAFRKAGAMIRKDMRGHLRKGYGEETRVLKKSISVRVKSPKGQPDVIHLIVGPGAKKGMVVTPPGRVKEQRRVPTMYAHLVEFGTAAHTIRIAPRRVTVLREGEPVEIETEERTVIHPGARPKPFIRPAIEAAKSKLKGVIAEALREAIARATAKAQAKGKSIFKG